MIKKLRIPLTVVLAFIAALVVTLGALQMHAWLTPKVPDNTGTAYQTFTDQEKLSVLSSLSGTSTSDDSTKSEKADVLKGLRATTSTGEQQKLDVLESLKTH